MNVPGSEEEGAEELEDHVVEFDAVADHVSQFLDHLALTAHLQVRNVDEV